VFVSAAILGRSCIGKNALDAARTCCLSGKALNSVPSAAGLFKTAQEGSAALARIRIVEGPSQEGFHIAKPATGRFANAADVGPFICQGKKKVAANAGLLWQKLFRFGLCSKANHSGLAFPVRN